MQKTFFTCDRCGEGWEVVDPKDPQRWQVSIGLDCMPISSPYVHTPILPNAHWCRKCVVEMGLLDGHDKEPRDISPATPPSIEDIIREIVREEVER